MNFLQGRIFGLPVWLVGGLALGVGVVVYIVVRRRNAASSTGGALGQNTTATPPDPNLDPNTGIPWSVEEAIDPNTGLPVYMTLLNQGNGMGGGQSGSTSGGTMQGGPAGPPQPSPVTPPGPAGPPQAAPSSLTTSATAAGGQTVQPSGRPGPVGPPIPPPGTAPGTGPKGPPGPGIGFAQAPGTPLQQGGKFRGTAAPYGTATARTWPFQDLTLHDVWSVNAHGVPWDTWRQAVMGMNPHLSASSGGEEIVYPWEQMRIP